MTSDSLESTEQHFSSMLREQKDHADFSNIESRRLKVYQDLFFNNIEGLLVNGFPVVKKILGEDEWKETIKKFWLEHRCQTPYFPKIGGEFVSWLQNNTVIFQEYPFLLELAHYELMEVVIDTADIALPDLEGAVENLRQQTILVINPVSQLLHYDYPVHQISQDFMPSEAGSEKTHLLIYRKKNHQVKFTQLSSASVILIDLLQTQERRLENLISITEQTMNMSVGSLAAHIEQQVRDFIEREIIFI